MNLLPDAKGYATQALATRKLINVFGENVDDVRWVITVNTEGRYVPTLVGNEYIATAIDNGLAVIS